MIHRFALTGRAHVSVDLGRLESLVAEERLNDAQFGPTVEELGREGVAEEMDLAVAQELAVKARERHG
jgi:hypothetical protein